MLLRQDLLWINRYVWKQHWTQWKYMFVQNDHKIGWSYNTKTYCLWYAYLYHLTKNHYDCCKVTMHQNRELLLSTVNGKFKCIHQLLIRQRLLCSRPEWLQEINEQYGDIIEITQCLPLIWRCEQTLNSSTILGCVRREPYFLPIMWRYHAKSSMQFVSYMYIIRESVWYFQLFKH